MFPIVMQFSGISEKYMPNDEFLWVPVKGLCVNGHLDLRNQEKGYVCFMQKDCKQLSFFEWFNEEFIYSVIVRIQNTFRKMSQLSSNISTENVEFNGSEETVIEWGDSNIPYLGLINFPTKIKRSVSRGIKKCKIGAKITESVQPLDVGPFFKILKAQPEQLRHLALIIC